jgi:hypothetical protein
MEKTAPEMRKMQFLKVLNSDGLTELDALANYIHPQGDEQDEEHLRKISPKWVEKYHVVDGINGGNTNGFIDMNGGITIANKVIDLERPWSCLNMCQQRESLRPVCTHDSVRRSRCQVCSRRAPGEA